MVPSSLDRPTGLYVYAVVVAGFAAVLHSSVSLIQQPADMRWLLLAALTLVSGSANVRLTAVSATISVSETFVCTSVLLFGAAAGTLTVTLDAVVMSLWMKRRYRSEFYRLLFNIAAPAASVWIAAQTFLLAGIPPLASHLGVIRLVDLALPLLTFTLLYFMLNSWLIAFAISLKEHLPVYPVWRDNLLWTSFNYFGGASVAALLVGYRASLDVALLLVVAPILLVLHFTFRSVLGRVEDSNQHLARVNRLYLSTIETLATAIDAKDQVTHGHIRRVQQIAMALARRIGVTEEAQIRAIEAAALLHDMGKLAVPDYILNKPGPLTSPEFAKMKGHAAVGADILAAIDFPYPVVPIVRHHHESWDGTGYPDGLKGTEIPIGARILSVVDCFDALTSDRPYRPKLSDEAALQILQERRGCMYDPLVVDAFIEHYPALIEGIQSAPEFSRDPALLAIAESAGRSTSGSKPRATQEPTKAAQGQDSVLQQISSDLRDCTIALLIRDELHDQLQVTHAQGADAESLLGGTVSLPSRVVGWVAANATSIHNADRRLDSLAWRSNGTCSAIPILHNQTAIGVLAVYTGGGRVLSNREIAVIEELAPLLAPELSKPSV
jgi:putative nucleotidyltransferase with HDIG domain